jgi:site-specific DNA-methyltransferase (adenine-specific)
VKPYYEHNGITIYHGDCREILPQIGTDSCDCVITDPPYSEQTQAGARSNPNYGFNESRSAFVPFFVPLENLRLILSECSRIAMRWIVATVDWKHAAELERTTPSGLRFVRCGVWVKPDGAPQFTGDRPAQGWEAVAILHRKDSTLEWNGGGSRAVWTHHIVRAYEIGHPTPKPLPLMKEFVQLFANSYYPILDPFCGSGTTLQAAKDAGISAIGIEIEEKYCEIAAKRLSQEVFQF